MFAHPTDPKATLPAVLINDNALVLSLTQADNQTVWRFDLDSLVEQGFRVSGRDGFYDLSVTDLSGSDHVLARFLDKLEAFRTLTAIHEALATSSGTASCGTSACTSPGKPSSGLCGCVRRMFGWLTFWRLLTLLGLGLLLYVLLKPFPMMTSPAVTQAEPPASGVPLDADQLLQ